MTLVAQGVPFLDLAREQTMDLERIEGAVKRVLESGRYVLGPEVGAFESEFADYLGVQHAIGVANGQEALEIALRGLGLCPDDEVIVPSMTFVATANAVQLAGARLVLCDVGRDGLIDVESMQAAITERTRAVIPVHLYGQCANMDAIAEVARRHGIKIVEDAAQAHGAEFRGRRAGGLGDVAAFSFYPSKNLGCLGDGGAITTNDTEIYERMRLLSNYGSVRKYQHEIVGRNSRLDEIQAAVLRVRLTDLEICNERRKAAAARYRQALAGLPLALPTEHSRGKHVYHVFAVNVSSSDERGRLREHLKERGVDTQCHYPLPVHDQPAYASATWPTFEHASRQARTTLSLPMFPSLKFEEIDHVTRCLQEFW